ncbi:beta-propeller domain-containing protein [Rubripirellula reticaptiva]|uniref:Arylsulfotransferase (ASST) n=1 Tax=Rubripirellula reticaptiva TaxID=2528013 RepID=A0A5C6EMV2_9BACT|nr:hypothetical protein [Rubripirellula reticaptiva]TWU49845.1 hypothetical protein Poly59_44700 [Rubripirellula reticaptiva]
MICPLPRFVFLLIGLAAIIQSTSGVAEETAIKHSFFVAGPVFTGIVGEDGETVWDSGRAGARDGWVLPNGNVLIAWNDVVKEFKIDAASGKNSQKTIVWQYNLDKTNKEIGTVQRLPSGLTLVTELGAKPRLMELDSEGKIQTEFPLQPETKNAHMQTRMARKLASGNYLVPHLLAFQVKEYTPSGEVVQSFATDLESLGGQAAKNWPFTAIRLENGNTVICLTNGNKVIEVDDQGKVVWSVTNEDLPGNPIDDACGGQRLPNGNTVIASYHAKVGVKLLEVTADKKIAWTYEGPNRVHHFQILTTNGQPVTGSPMK